ncbi:MAG: ECF-type sigma factor [Vicinamibacterales bacterium]
MKAADSHDVTVLLQAWSAGDMAARDEVMDISIATTERDWQAARAWLLKELRGGATV